MHSGKLTTKAFGKPGIPPRWTSSSKEAVGTAYSTSSRVWFTLSHGILNEVYYPTIDRPQVRDFQFLVSDGETFFHEEKRDLECSINYIEPEVLGFRITCVDPEGRYHLIKEIITDPHQACILIRGRFDPDPEWEDRLHLFALLAPHLQMSGAGNSARAFTTGGHNLLVAWRGLSYLAFGVNTNFSRTSCGFVGISDGWQDLNADYTMDWEFDRAEDGNVAMIGEVDLSKGNVFTTGIAFGDSLHASVTTLLQSLTVPFPTHKKRYCEQWRRVCQDGTSIEKMSGDGGQLYRISRSLLLAHEDKTFAGAMIASASIPWGQAKGDEDIGGYHLVWTRDMVHSADGLLAAGNRETPRRALVYLVCSQRPDGGFPQNFWLDGSPYWGSIQLDEVAFPVMLAWRLWKAGALAQLDPYPMVRAAAQFLIRKGPMTQQERWEENSGYSPSTIAASIAALMCAASFARDRRDTLLAVFLEEYADFLESHVERWTVTTAGSLLPSIPRHYIRIHPTDINDVSPDEDPNNGVLAIPNRPPGSDWQFPARDIVDAGFLELVRYGIRKPADTLIEDSLKVVDAVLKVDTPFGPCWRRYNHDGYGQRPDGGPYLGWGKGRAWPLLTGERAHYEFAAGRSVKHFIKAMEGFSSRGGMLPEQIWDVPQECGSRACLGHPTGSAMPLMWAHAEYIQLLKSTLDGKVFDVIPIVAERYLYKHGRKDLEIWKPFRQVRQVTPGQTLRIQAPELFRLRWSVDEWETSEDTPSVHPGLEICYVDLPILHDQKAPVRFTFYWTEHERWEGRDYRVDIAAP